MGNAVASRNKSHKYRRASSQQHGQRLLPDPEEGVVPRRRSAGFQAPELPQDGSGQWGRPLGTARKRSWQELESKRATACAAVQLMHEEEEEACACLWADLGKALRQAFGHCEDRETAEQVRGVVLAATLVRSSAQLARSLQDATLKVNMEPCRAALLHELLRKVTAQEQLEGLWRCLSSSLADKDYVAVALWLDYARARGLDVPMDVKEYLRAAEENAARESISFDGDEDRFCVCSSDWDSFLKSELQELFEDCVIEATRLRDAVKLRRLAEEAELAGADPSMAHAALLQIEEIHDAAAPSGLHPHRVPSPGEHTPVTFRQAACADAAKGVGTWSVRALKAELAAMGVDLRGVCETIRPLLSAKGRFPR